MAADDPELLAAETNDEFAAHFNQVQHSNFLNAGLQYELHRDDLATAAALCGCNHPCWHVTASKQAARQEWATEVPACMLGKDWQLTPVGTTGGFEKNCACCSHRSGHQTYC